MPNDGSSTYYIITLSLNTKSLSNLGLTCGQLQISKYWNIEMIFDHWKIFGRCKIKFWTTFVFFTKLIFPLPLELESFKDFRKSLDKKYLASKYCLLIRSHWSRAKFASSLMLGQIFWDFLCSRTVCNVMYLYTVATR